MSKFAAVVIELAASASVTVGAFMFFPPLGWVVGGGFGLLFAKGLAK